MTNAFNDGDKVELHICEKCFAEIYKNLKIN